MTRIVHLTASTFFGGPERQMLGLAEHLRPEFETTFVSFSEGGRCRPFLRKVHEAGFRGIELTHDSPHFFRAINDIQTVLPSVDVLFVHGYKAGLLGRIAARRSGLPIIAVSRGWTAENWKVAFYERLDQWNLKKMDRVVCVSYGQAEKVLRVGVSKSRVEVIHNAARLRDFEKRSEATRPHLLVLAAGRLSPEKGYQLLPAIAERVQQAGAPVQFQLAGDGPLRSSIENEARERGVLQSIEFLGFRTDIDRLMNSADVMLLPSYTEGLPNVVLEASAAGIPSVATRVGGTPEAIIDGDTGFLVPSGDVFAIADSIIHLANHSEQRLKMGLAARRLVETVFSFGTQAAAYRSLIGRVLPIDQSSELVSC